MMTFYHLISDEDYYSSATTSNWHLRCKSEWVNVCCLMPLSTIFQFISWRSVLLMEETGGPEEKHRPVASHWQTLSHNVVHPALVEIRTYMIA